MATFGRRSARLSSATRAWRSRRWWLRWERHP